MIWTSPRRDVWLAAAIRATIKRMTGGPQGDRYYVTRGPNYLGSNATLEDAKSRAERDERTPRAYDSITVAPARVTPTKVKKQAADRRRTRIPRLRGTFTMLDDENTTATGTDTPETATVATEQAPKKKKKKTTTAAKEPAMATSTAKRKKTAAKKTAAHSNGAGRPARYPDEATFQVNIDKAKNDRREGSTGLKHVLRLDGKTFGAVRKTDWFQPWRLKRDIESGALKIIGAK